MSLVWKDISKAVGIAALTHDFFAYDKSSTYKISEKNISQIGVDSGKLRWHD
jgi:hypothetical protein